MIHQAELFPILVGLYLWRERLYRRHVLIFVDNDACRAALIKGSSQNASSAQILTWIWQEIVVSQCLVWVDRVPSTSNPADEPSRGEISALIDAGFTLDADGEFSLREKGWGERNSHRM